MRFVIERHFHTEHSKLWLDPADLARFTPRIYPDSQAPASVSSASKNKKRFPKKSMQIVFDLSIWLSYKPVQWSTQCWWRPNIECKCKLLWLKENMLIAISYFITKIHIKLNIGWNMVPFFFSYGAVFHLWFACHKLAEWSALYWPRPKTLCVDGSIMNFL